MTVGQHAIRPEYVALAGELAFLRTAFGLPCTATHREQVSATLAAFECIDRHYDALAAGPARSTLGATIVHVVATGSVDAAIPAELAAQVRALRSVFETHAAAARCAELLGEFCAATECVRTTRKPHEYVRGVLREGQLTSAMVLLLLDRDSRFSSFFLRLGRVANLVDKLCDVRGDYARDEIALYPSAAVHVRLLASFIAGAVPLALAFPRPLAFARWGLRYFRLLLQSQQAGGGGTKVTVMVPTARSAR